MIKSLWNYRHFILASVKGEIKNRFARSNLGALWCVLHPLAQSLIFTIVLAEVLGAKFPGTTNKAAYPIYLMAGNAAWGLFSEIMNRCITIFIDNAGTLKKISFPRMCLPIIVWGSAMINHLLLLSAMAMIFMFFGQFPGWAWFALPIGILLISLFAFGMGVILGILNVFWRDIGQAMGIVMQIWYWMTPIVYVADIIPQQFKGFLQINPLVAIIRIYQDALLYNRWPEFSTLVPSMGAATLLFVVAFFLFRRASAELVDEL